MKDTIVKDICKIVENRSAVLFWSGGYDSTFLFKLILDYKLYEKTELSIVMIRCPQEIYDGERVDKTLKLLSELPVHTYCYEPEENIASDIEFSGACAVCKRIRRAVITKALKEIRSRSDSGKETVLLTGHNLDDLAGYYLENVAYSLTGDLGTGRRERFIESANKTLPIFEYCDTVKIFRPLIKYTKAEILRLFSDEEYRELTVCYKKCRWLMQRKRLLQEFLTRANIELSFSAVAENFCKNFKMPTMDEYRSLPLETYLM